MTWSPILNVWSNYLLTIHLFILLIIYVDNADTSACLLNTDLEKIHKWSKLWLVSFNPTKTECLTISNKVKKPFHPSLIFNDVHLKEVETHKHLGVILSSNLSWNLHVDETVKKNIFAPWYDAKTQVYS